MPGRRRAQTSIYETTIENTELEAALGNWASAKDKLSEATHNAKVHRARVDALIEPLDLAPNTPVRVGEYVIELRARDEADVSFTRTAGQQLLLKGAKDDE